VRTSNSLKTVALIALALSVGVSVGCSKSKRRNSASTVAPSTTAATNTNTNTAPVATAAPPPVAVVNPPPAAPAPLTSALVASWNLKEVLEVDMATGQVNNRWPTGDGPIDMAHGLTETYVANAMSQDVTVIDRLANNTSQTIDISSTPITGISFLSFLDNVLKPLVRPTGIVVTPNKQKIYTANLLNVVSIDAATKTPTKSILGLSSISLTGLISNPGQALSNFMAAPVQGLGMAKLAATNQYVLATCMITGKVMRIDAMTDRVVDYIDVGRAPLGIAIARNKAYVACVLSQEIYVIDVATGAVLTTIKAGMIPVDVAVNPNEDRIYVANAVSGDITVIDTMADQVVDTMPAGMAISQIFTQLGITLPSGSGGGIGGALNGFLQGFTGGMTNPASFGALITGGGGGLLSPGNLINGLLSGFLAYAGINQAALGGLNLPGIGIMSIGVSHSDEYICAGNAFMGQLALTEIANKNVSTVSGLTGLGPVDIEPMWRR
jgi:YVTN family beta-propeller protein